MRIGTLLLGRETKRMFKPYRIDILYNTCILCCVWCVLGILHSCKQRNSRAADCCSSWNNNYYCNFDNEQCFCKWKPKTKWKKKKNSNSIRFPRIHSIILLYMYVLSYTGVVYRASSVIISTSYYIRLSPSVRRIIVSIRLPVYTRPFNPLLRQKKITTWSTVGTDDRSTYRGLTRAVYLLLKKNDVCHQSYNHSDLKYV